MVFLVILNIPQSSGNAYLDPGSGSFILQILLAALLGGAFAIKIYWKKIVALFKKSRVKEEDQTDNIQK